jgi:dephospho-CoA kinase
MKQIVIQVIGGAAVGKSTVCEMIKELFDLYGIETDFIDPDLPFKMEVEANLLSNEDEEETKRREKERKTKRVISVINSLDKIVIEEKQAYKKGVEEYITECARKEELSKTIYNKNYGEPME